MEQNNFEKTVQHKLDELKIPPSDSVWINVEKHIGKNHKDRRIIFIFLFILLLSGGYWLLNSSKNHQNKNQQLSSVLKTKKISKITNNQDSSFDKPQITSTSRYKHIDSASVSKEKIKIAEVGFQNKPEKKNGKKQRKLIKDFTPKSNKNYSKGTNKEDSELAFNNLNKLIEKKADIGEIENKNESENIETNLQNSTESFSKKLKAQNSTHKLIVKTDSSIKKAQKKQSLVFGITLSGGTSFIGSNILERNYPPANMNSGAPGIPGYYDRSPSTIKNSTAFVAGVFVEKNVSDKAKVSLGLSYKYYSVINKVGNKIDSVLAASQYSSFNNFYSSATPFHSYRNNFHYLEAPLSIKLQLNKNKSESLFWNAGIDISQLIGSNALQFKTDSGLYYRDNSMFNKTQFGLHTGLSLTIFSQQKTPFTFGPYFYYSPTNLANKGLYNKSHFNFIGLRAEISFEKK